MTTAPDKDTAFAELVRPYEDQWVALAKRDGEEIVVGSGKDPAQALEAAKSQGFTSPVLFSVPSFSKTFIPSGFSPSPSTPN